MAIFHCSQSPVTLLFIPSLHLFNFFFLEFFNLLYWYWHNIGQSQAVLGGGCICEDWKHTLSTPDTAHAQSTATRLLITFNVVEDHCYGFI